MNTTQALAKLRKLLGPKAAIGDRKRESSPEMRATALEQQRAANAAWKEVDEALSARRKALLAGDPEYQNLLAEWNKTREAKNNIRGAGFRYAAGKDEGLFFHVEVEADNLADLVEKAQAKLAQVPA